MIHMTRPEIFDNAAAPVRDGCDLDHRHVHFRLRIAENFAKRVLRFSDARQNFSFNDYFRVCRNHELIAPGRRRRKAERFF